MRVLPSAEARLRAGDLQAAVDECTRALDGQPDDPELAAMLGELQARGGDLQSAAERFVAAAEALHRAGETRRSAALLWRTLAIQPDNEPALLFLADAALEDDRAVDACAHLAVVAEHRAAAGDRAGAGAIRIRIASLAPVDVDAQLAAATARREAGDSAAAFEALKRIGVDLLRRNRFDTATVALEAATAIDSNDVDVRRGLFEIYMSTGDLTRAADYIVDVEQVLALAEVLEAIGRHDEALVRLGDALRQHHDDPRVRAAIARHHLLDGNAVLAADHLTAEMALGDPGALCAIAEIRLRGNRSGDAQELLATAVNREPSLADTVARLGCEMAPHAPGEAFEVVDIALTAWFAAREWAKASVALQQFLVAAPGCVPALLKLVEVMVEAGDEEGASKAQAELTDAYLRTGDGMRALAIAEDLAEREPSNPDHARRIDRALALMSQAAPSSQAV